MFAERAGESVRRFQRLLASRAAARRVGELVVA